MRKRAVQASRFMLEMMQAPLYSKESNIDNENGEVDSSKQEEESAFSFASRQEGVAIRIATEVRFNYLYVATSILALDYFW